MRKKLLLAVVAAAGFILPFFTQGQTSGKENAEKLKLHFDILKHGNYGEGTVAGNRENGFAMTLKNTAKQNHVIALANFKRDTAAQEKLVFRLLGSKNNGNAFLNVELLYERGKEWITVKSPSIPLRNVEFKTCRFGLDTDFKLGDGVYRLRQIKFVLNADSNPQGSVAKIQVEDVRIVSADELSASGADFAVVPFPKAVPGRRGVESPLKVWFEFDSDDRSSLVQSRVSPGKFQDRASKWSFRQLLLEHAEGLIQDADSPEQADVIVYSRAGKGDAARRIAETAEKGRRLIVYGTPADPEIAALLPVTLSPAAGSGFPERKTLVVKRQDHPLVQAVKLTGAAPGVYCRPVGKEGADVVLAFADGTPFLTERKNILHVNAGIGCRLDASDSVFYDKFLLHAVALSSKPVAEALEKRDREVRQLSRQTEQKRVLAALKEAGVPAEEAGKWRLGLSSDSMGRFGWLIGEPLLTDTVGKDLSVSNETQHFGFATGGFAVVPFSNWQRKAVKGKIVFTSEKQIDADPCELWSGIGTVQYDTTLKMEPEWKGKSIFFEVKDGIDDLDEFLFNGELVGKTGEDTPYYWSVPRRYRIPAERILWGKENRFTVRVRNLRDNARMNSRPFLSISEGRAKETLSVSRIDWCGKNYRLQGEGGTREMSLSLLTPFLRWRFPQKEVFLNLENIADSAAYQTADGIRIVPLKNGGVFYRKSEHGAWNAPWLLLFRSGKTRPLLLVFSRQVEELKARSRNGNVEGIAIRGSKELGFLALGRPWGVREMECSAWKRNLPEKTLEQIRLSLNFALNFPVACEEVFSIDRNRRVVDIINVFRFERTRDDWNTPVKEFAFLPALCGFMAQEKRLVVPRGTMTDFQIPTVHGPLTGVLGNNAVRYTLPLPPDDDLMAVGVKDREINKFQNRSFEGGVRWSCGGRVPMNAWTPEAPAGAGNPQRSIDLFAWNFGLCSALQGAFFLDDANRKRLEKRVRQRFLEPIELFQYKTFARHRQEPFSRLNYPVVFNSFYPNTASYAGDMGSVVIYGDSNEACTVAVWIARQLADGFGQADLARLNWNCFRYVMRYQKYIDDYVFLAGSCRETGVGAWVDMLNGEYSGMLAYARLAELNGDAAEQEQALYRAARKAVPTLARLFFHRYFETIRPEFRGKTDYQIVGFGEDGAKYMRFPNSNGNFFAANDLFDYSQGFPGQLILLYQKYGVPEIETHLRTRAIPLLMKQPKGFLSEYLPVLAVFAGDLHLRDAVRKSMALNPRTGDWPGIRVPTQLGMVLWNETFRISFREWSELNIHSACYDPEKRLLSLSVDAVPGSRLTLSSSAPPERVVRNGKTVRTEQRENGWTVPLEPGANQMEVLF